MPAEVSIVERQKTRVRDLDISRLRLGERRSNRTFGQLGGVGGPIYNALSLASLHPHGVGKAGLPLDSVTNSSVVAECG